MGERTNHIRILEICAGQTSQDLGERLVKIHTRTPRSEQAQLFGEGMKGSGKTLIVTGGGTREGERIALRRNRKKSVWGNGLTGGIRKAKCIPFPTTRGKKGKRVPRLVTQEEKRAMDREGVIQVLGGKASRDDHQAASHYPQTKSEEQRRKSAAKGGGGQKAGTL